MRRVLSKAAMGRGWWCTFDYRYALPIAQNYRPLKSFFNVVIPMYFIHALGETGIKVVLFTLMFIVFYIFLIRPRQKEEERKEQFIESLTQGKSVVTVGGIHGKIIDVGKETVVLEVDKKGSQITVGKGYIAVRAEA